MLYLKCMKYLIDTARIISEGCDATIHQDYELVATSYTLSEIQSKGLKVDSSNISIISSPVFSDFKNKENNFYTWSNGTSTLQIIKWERKSYIPALCGKHDATFIISVIGGSAFYSCGEILAKNADFSQITAMLLYDNIKPIGTPDDCLKISLNKIFVSKNNSTNLCH